MIDGLMSAAAMELQFEKELRALINRHGRDNAANTPDYVLAQFLETCLAAFTTAAQQRDTHDGRDARPTATCGLDSGVALQSDAPRSYGSVVCDIRKKLLEHATKLLEAGNYAEACLLLEQQGRL